VRKAWATLGTTRAHTLAGPGPIPWDVAHEYARYHGLSRDEEEELWEYLQAMDAEWMAKD
jgi:hypothetical protein